MLSLGELVNCSTGLLLNVFNIYVYLIGTVFICGLALIVCDRDWHMLEEMYLNAVMWVQNQLIKLHDVHPHPKTATHQNNSSNNNCAISDPFCSMGSSDQHQQKGASTTPAELDTDNVFVEGSISSNSSSNESPTDADDSFELLQSPPAPNVAVFELGNELCAQALQSIANAGVGSGFRLATDYCRYELKELWTLHISRHYNLWRFFRHFSRKVRLTHPRCQNGIIQHQLQPRRVCSHQCHSAPAPPLSSTERRLLRLMLVSSLAFRFFALFPLRLAFLLVSFVYLFVCGAWDLLRPLSPLLKTRLAVIYCRLYSTGCGFITRFQGTENRPKRPGVICANHLSPNDIPVIFGDIPADRDYLYMVTGQKHLGFIWVLENLVQKVCPAIWLERADAESRHQFSVQVLEEAKHAGPVILFPEGYCTNNSMVLRFRRAVFQDNVTVYPVAIRQESRFGDAYWSEDNFMRYLFRVMTSWSIVYNVHYLAPQHRRPNESATDFAARVQRLIAARVGVRSIAYDGGGIWYKEADRQKAYIEWQKRSAVTLVEKMNAKVSATTTDTEEERGEEEEEPTNAIAKREMSADDKAMSARRGEESVDQRVTILSADQQHADANAIADDQLLRTDMRRRLSRSAVLDTVVVDGCDDSDEMDLIG